MANSSYIKQFDQQINSLLIAKKYQQAILSYQTLSKKFPDNRALLKIGKKIQKHIDQESNKSVEAKLQETKILWKQKNYQQILRQLMPLLKTAPNNEKLKRKIEKAQKLYTKKINRLEEEFIEKQEKKLKELIDKDPQQFIKELLSLEQENPGNIKVKELTQNFKEEIIDKKIARMKELLQSNKYSDIQNLISQLKKIDPENEKIIEIEEDLKRRKYGTQMENLGNYIYKGEQHLKTLMKLKKYEKAIIVANEILHLDTKNKNTEKTLKKAQAKSYITTREEMIKIISESNAKLAIDYRADKSTFIKI